MRADLFSLKTASLLFFTSSTFFAGRLKFFGGLQAALGLYGLQARSRLVLFMLVCTALHFASLESQLH